MSKAQILVETNELRKTAKPLRSSKANIHFAEGGCGARKRGDASVNERGTRGELYRTGRTFASGDRGGYSPAEQKIEPFSLIS